MILSLPSKMTSGAKKHWHVIFAWTPILIGAECIWLRRCCRRMHITVDLAGTTHIDWQYKKLGTLYHDD